MQYCKAIILQLKINKLKKILEEKKRFKHEKDIWVSLVFLKIFPDTGLSLVRGGTEGQDGSRELG